LLIGSIYTECGQISAICGNVSKRSYLLEHLFWLVAHKLTRTARIHQDDSIGDLCTECGRALGKNPLFFEVNTSWEVIAPNSDEKNSQGCFAIGQTCANKFAPGLLIKSTR
jgi:hypothetical protein